jgi:hypothetical protein
MTIKARQLYYILIGMVTLLCLGLFGVAYSTDTILGAQATKLSKLKAESDALQAQESTLAKNKKDIEKYKDLNIIAQTIVPQDKDQAQAVREIVNIAAQSGINKLSSITFPSSALGSTARGPGTSGNPNLTQLTPVKGLAGVYELQITIVQDSTNRVPYDKFTTFLEKLEQNRRTAQVSAITVQPDALHPDSVAFTLVVNEYIKP